MSIQLVQKLEEKVDQALETIGMLRLEIEELDNDNSRLKAENAELKHRQTHWEQSLASLLRKLSNTDLSTGVSPSQSQSHSSSDLRQVIHDEEEITI